MICKEWLAEQRRILEEAGILPRGNDDEHQVLLHGVPLGTREGLVQPGRAPADLHLCALWGAED